MIAHCFNPKDVFKFEVDVTKGYVDELRILSHTMYGRMGITFFEQQHFVEQIIIHPDFVSNSK